MMGRYMMGYATGWMWMSFMMILMIAGWVIFLIALWRIMKAKESMAKSVAEISQHIQPK